MEWPDKTEPQPSPQLSRPAPTAPADGTSGKSSAFPPAGPPGGGGGSVMGARCQLFVPAKKAEDKEEERKHASLFSELVAGFLHLFSGFGGAAAVPCFWVISAC